MKKAQLKPEYQGAIIYLDGYRNELKCIGITIPTAQAPIICSGRDKALMNVIITPLLHSVCRGIDIKDVDMCFVTTAQDAVDSGWFEDMDALVGLLGEYEDAGDEGEYNKIFELVD